VPKRAKASDADMHDECNGATVQQRDNSFVPWCLRRTYIAMVAKSCGFHPEHL
jgi:hypothetical protein